MPARGGRMERFERKITVLDVIMIALAVISLGLLVYDEVYRPPQDVHEKILLVDYAIIGLFALEYLYRLAQAKHKWQFVKGHWYDLLGMVPVSHPLFRAFRFARIFRIVVIASRLVRATDRTLGEAWVRKKIQSYREAFVEELTDPIVLSVLGVAERSLLKGHYGTAVAQGLRAKRDEVLARIEAQLRTEESLHFLLKIPGIGGEVEKLLTKVPAKIFDGVIATVASKEIDETITSVLREIFADLRREVAVRDWRKAQVDAAQQAAPA